MSKIYGVDESIPYDRWPNEALKRLQEDLGRNGDAGPESERIQEKVDETIKDREGTSVDYDSNGNLSYGV